MISSEDVRHVTFDKAFQGYRREDVDDYLKQVAQPFICGNRIF